MTRSAKVYDRFDDLIDICEENGYTETATHLREVRDNLPNIPDPTRYVAYWSRNGYNEAVKVIVGFKWFEEMGYNEESLATIEKLDVGEVKDVNDGSGVHYILRVE